jgi:hypothetical protein
LGVKGGWSIRLTTAICEPIVYKIWRSKRFTILRAFTAYYRDSFIFGGRGDESRLEVPFSITS